MRKVNATLASAVLAACGAGEAEGRADRAPTPPAIEPTRDPHPADPSSAPVEPPAASASAVAPQPDARPAPAPRLADVDRDPELAPALRARFVDDRPGDRVYAKARFVWIRAAAGGGGAWVGYLTLGDAVRVRGGDAGAARLAGVAGGGS